jgi:hypothetical protein
MNAVPRSARRAAIRREVAGVAGRAIDEQRLRREPGDETVRPVEQGFHLA